MSTDPVTAPDMVSVIASALAGHRTVHEVLYADYYSCSCGHRGKEQPSAHQARAVLAAISEAGEVEYAVLVDRNHYKFQSRYLDKAKQFANIHEGQLLSRIKAGPWTVVEG